MSEYKTAFTKRGGELAMAYDKSEDFKAIQADVLTIDTADNELISNLKKLKTDNKSITKAINALNEQLGNAQTSASDAVQRVVALETLVAQLRARLENSNNDQQLQKAEHVVGMVLAEEGNKSGTWVRVDRDFNTVEFNPEHGTWASMKTVMNDTYGEFVEIPVTYVKTETLIDGPYVGKNCWWTADGPETGFHVHPAFIGQDGKPHPLQVASWITSNKNDVPFSEDKGDSYEGYWNNISYNDVHAKSWMADGLRPYNIYDHHFLARLMLTEFGTPDVRNQVINDVAWDGEHRIVYHGIHDLFGLPNDYEYCWLDGLTTLNGTYQVLAADGSLSMVQTDVACLAKYGLITNCLVDQAGNVNFGDLFIASGLELSENLGSFTSFQNLNVGNAFYVNWNLGNGRGAFFLHCYNPENKSEDLGWRISRCV